MQQVVRLALGLSVAVGLCGCAAMPAPPHAVAANVAIENAMGRLYEQPSYRIHVSSHLGPVDSGHDKAAASGPTGPVPGADSARAAQDMLYAVQAWTGLVGSIFQRTEFDADGVIDFRHSQFELIPIISYKSQNAGAYVRVPMMFDLAADEGYADLSATSPVFVNPANDGKYSAFSLRPLTDRVDLKKLVNWWRDFSRDLYAAIDAADCRDLPLTPADTAAGGVRKIALSLPFDDFRSTTRAVADAHQAEFKEALKDSRDKDDSAAAKKPDASFADFFVSALIKEGEPSLADQKSPPAATMHGTLEETYLLDSSGNIIETTYRSTMTSAKLPVAIGIDARIQYSDFGSAEVGFRPTAGNTIAYDENRKGSTSYMLSLAENNNSNPSAAGAGVAAPATAVAQNYFVGTWQRTVSGQCTATYYVPNNNNALLTSGKEVAYIFYTLEAAPDQQGFFKLVERRRVDNAQKDCAGNVGPKNPVTTSYLQFNPAKTVLRMCGDETLDHCSQLTRVPDDKP